MAQGEIFGEIFARAIRQGHPEHECHSPRAIFSGRRAFKALLVMTCCDPKYADFIEKSILFIISPNTSRLKAFSL